MRIVCSGHARQRLRERFGVQWDVELEEDIGTQLLASAGPLTAPERGGLQGPAGATYWEVRIAGAHAVLVIASAGLIVTVLRHLNNLERPRRQRRRKQKKTSGGKRPAREVPSTDYSDQ